MPNYQAKNSPQLEKQLKVQELAITFRIEGNAVPANVVLSTPDSGLIYLKSEGVDQITSALAPNEDMPTYTAQNDANGQFSILVDVNEVLKKVVGAYIVSVTLSNPEVIACTIPTGTNVGITSGTGGGKKIALDADSSVDLSVDSYDGCLIIKYTTAQ